MSEALEFLLTFTGSANRHQEAVIDYLREENRVLREQLGFRDDRGADTVKWCAWKEMTRFGGFDPAILGLEGPMSDRLYQDGYIRALFRRSRWPESCQIQHIYPRFGR